MQDQGYTYLRSYRYERKFLVEDLQPFQVKALIKQHPRLFHEPYPPRNVNNLYLDTPDLVNYYDNVDGASRRRKIRVRWYGAEFGQIKQPMLEVKVKDGLVGTKHTYPLASFRLDAKFCDRALQKILSESDLPDEVRFILRGIDVVLFNRYYRHYFTDQEKAFRLTMDSVMIFYKVNGLFGNQFIHRQTDHCNTVVELKYEVDQETKAGRVAGYFPFRMTRNSKYVQGMERVYF